MTTKTLRIIEFEIVGQHVAYSNHDEQEVTGEKQSSKFELRWSGLVAAALLITPALMSFIIRSHAPSGMGIADHSKNSYLDLQRKKLYRYLIFKIDEDKSQIVIEKTGRHSENYDDFTAALPHNDCRYAVYDFDFVTPDNCQKSKIFFIAWSPSTSRIRSKMLYATSKNQFSRQLQGIHYEIQATDPTEMDIEVLRDRAF
ncbi:hypothetical protein ACFE04_004798 [Oxalis oulophora]